MGRKKNGYIRKGYESDLPGTGGHDSYFPYFSSQRNSLAFKKLTGNQRELYAICREQQYNRHGKKPGELYPDWKECQLDTVFFMNWGLVQETGLYRSKHTFYNDLQKLIELGFIECLYNGKTSRNKSIYKYSERWRNYGSEK